MNAITTVDGIEGLRAWIGRELGPSAPVALDGATVRAFAEATGDHQWIHLDADRATAEGPYGGPIAHGYLVLSLVPTLLFDRLLRVDNVSAIINYGANKLRFPDVARVGAEVSLRARLDKLQPKGEGTLATFTLTFEASGSDRPCCVAEVLLLFV